MAETEAEAELDLHLENSSSFWTSFTSRIAEIREELRTLRADVAGDSERLQKMKVQLSGLQVCKSEEEYSNRRKSAPCDSSCTPVSPLRSTSTAHSFNCYVH